MRHTIRGALFVLVGLLGPATAHAQPTAADAEGREVTAAQAAPEGTLVAHGAPALPAAVLPSTPVDFAIEADQLEARTADGRVAWRFDLRSTASTPGRVVGPEPTEAGVWVAQRADVWLLDRESGRVRVRHRVPGDVEALAVVGDAVEATCSGDEGAPWRQVLTLSAREPHVGPQPTAIASALATRRRADWLLERSLAGDGGGQGGAPAPDRPGIDTVTIDTVAIEELARVAAELGAAEAFDPTNPWIPLHSARVALRRGDVAGARAAAGRALGVDDAYAMELLPIAAALDAIDPELADRAFVRGLESARAAGWDPQMATSLVVVLTWIGRPELGEELSPEAELAELVRRTERVWQFAPHVESASVAYDTLADRLEAATDLSAAAEWRARADAARPWTYFGAPRTGHIGVGFWVSLLVALGGAAVTGTAIRLLRWSPAWWAAARTGSASMRVPTRAWSRAELLGTLAVLGLLVWVGLEAGRGVAVLGRVASAPVAVGGGFPGHPEVSAFWSTIEGPEAAQMASYAAAWSERPGSAPMPPIEVVARAWEGGIGRVDPLAAATTLSAVDPAEGNHWMTTLATQMPLLVVLLLVVSGLPGARVRSAARAGTPGWLGFVLALLVPGTGRGYGALGPAVTAWSLLWLQAWQVWGITDGQALWILDSIALPNFAPYWGLAAMETTASPLETRFVQLGGLVWLLNVGVVVAAETLRPSHGGVFAR